MIAPYVRKITVEVGEKGDRITNFDIRFLQPNKQEMPTGVRTFISGFIKR